jgi:type VI secretion system protein ImpJ
MLGELTTFSRDRRPTLQPAYVHDDLQLSFDPLEVALSALLARIREAKAIALPVEYYKEQRIWVSRNIDQALLEKGVFIMSVRAAMSSEELVSKYRNQTKVGAVLDMKDLISGAKKGIGLKPLPAPPPDLPRKAGWQYFEIDTTSDLWRNVLDPRNPRAIAFHMDYPLPDMQQELWAIRTGQD